jgi:hypothetical protein
MEVSDGDAGDVTVVIVGKSSTGEHPIHDRWWLSEKSGLRFGTSANSLRIGKLSEISEIVESDVTARVAEVDPYLAGSVREFGGGRLKSVTFRL